MTYTIVLAPGAVRELRDLSAFERAQVRDAIERHLRHTPTRVSRSRIKRLRGVRRPHCRLRVGDIRVFYDVSGDQVQILAVISKSQAQKWLEQEGGGDEESRPGQD